MGNAGNPYSREIETTVPRLLASYDCDPLSPTLGLGDRRYWGWKLQDFANATPQGAANGLARLLAAGLLPPGLGSDSVLRRIDEMIRAIPAITAKDGSLVEAFPNEKSFCVTALVAFDVLSAIDQLGDRIRPDQQAAWRETVAPLIDFIVANDETHAIISNHLATAVAALTRWSGGGEAVAEGRAKDLLDIILQEQAGDGWFSEYGAADPGYETLGIHYLADVHLRRPDLALERPLERSLEFLVHFAHPDGSFGGTYGSRNTRFIVPGGLEALAPTMPAARALADFGRSAIANRTIVTLSAFDEPNLAPNFNAYCQAAVLFSADQTAEAGTSARFELPFEKKEPFRRSFAESNLIVDNGPDHYTIVAPAKGGVVVHCKKDGTPAKVDGGNCGRIGKRTCTTQAFRPDNTFALDDEKLVVEAPFVEIVSERPTPLKFFILRLLSLTLFRFRPLTEMVKRALVRRLITHEVPLGPVNRRTIRFGPDIEISDEVIPPGGVDQRRPDRPFSAIHMASAGYWQASDDAP